MPARGFNGSGRSNSHRPFGFFRDMKRISLNNKWRDAKAFDEFTVFLLDAIGAVAAHLGQELGIGEQWRDIAVADPVELEVRPLGIHRHDRDAARVRRPD